MLYSRSKLKIKDNSGIIIAQVIQTKKSKNSMKPCITGDFLKASVKKGRSSLHKVTASSKVQNLTGSNRLHNFVVVNTKKSLRRYDGTALRLNTNSAITINDRKLALFKKVSGVVTFELKKNCSSVLNLAKNVL